MPCGQTYCAQLYYSFTVTGGPMTVGSLCVGCLAQDEHGNSTPTRTFIVTVTDYVHDVTPPVFQNVPGPITAVADSSGRALLSWPAITATDDHDGVRSVQ